MRHILVILSRNLLLVRPMLLHVLVFQAPTLAQFDIYFRCNIAGVCFDTMTKTSEGPSSRNRSISNNAFYLEEAIMKCTPEILVD